ncbi:hypothetical protein I9W82_001145 [Candida metapsilosis]|uniref:UBA domain-containing protein n=1 Tax=Candida metapsilosis TaxID=273372 RepID=A0A8H7ZHA9_9ASCO|nr:hypothetical protein I9W82_001145 [Candida metapsilosis]
MDSKIKQLEEMGFTRDQAESALQRANNDMEQAIGYLFGDSEEHHPTEAQMFDEDYNNNRGTVAISNPQDIPSFPLSETQEYAYSNDWGSESEQLDLNESLLFENPQVFLRNNETIPAVVPKLANTPGRFVIPLYVIFCQIRAFSDLLLSKDVSQEFKEDWFAASEEEVTNDSESFIAAIQRLIGFFSPASERAFISSEWFYNRVSESFKAREFEDWDDLVTAIGKDLEKNVKSILDKDFNLLSSYAASQEGELKPFKCVNIESEGRESTLVESLSKLFWSPESYAINGIAPILGIQISPDDTVGQVSALNVEESLYPALFTTKYRSLIEEMDKKRTLTAKKRTTITSRIMALSSFEGKKIRSFVNKARDYMEEIEESEVHEDLSKLSNSIKNESSQLNETLKQINNEYVKFDTSNQENIIEEVKKNEELDIPSKYQLVGVVFSDTHYAYRSRLSSGDHQWVLFLAETNNGAVIDFKTTPCSFKEINSIIHDEPADKYIFLVYADESALQGAELDLPPSLSSFFTKDNEFLHNQIEKHESKSSELEQVDNTSSERVSREDTGEVKSYFDTDLIDM